MVAFGAIFTSCVKDKGNYDYQDINEVIIDSIKFKDGKTQYNGGELVEITSYVSFTGEGEAKDNFTYEWWLLKAGSSDGRKLFEGYDTKDITFPAFAIEASYELTLVVRNKRTDVATKKAVNFRTQSDMAAGYLGIYNNSAGDIAVDMITGYKSDIDAFNVYKDIYSTSLMPRAGSTAIAIVPIKSDLGAGGNYSIWVCGSLGSYRSNYTFIWEDTKGCRVEGFVRSNSALLSGPIIPERFVHAGVMGGARAMYFYMNGNWYFRSNYALVVPFDKPVNTIFTSATDPGTVCNVAPYISWGPEGAIMWDTDNNRFIYQGISRSASNGIGQNPAKYLYSKVVTDAVDKDFTVVNPNWRLIYMGKYGTGGIYSFAILKDVSTGNLKYIDFHATNSAGVITKNHFQLDITDPGKKTRMENAKFFARNYWSNYLYYVTSDNKVFAVQLSSGGEVEQTSVANPNNHEITAFKQMNQYSKGSEPYGGGADPFVVEKNHRSADYIHCITVDPGLPIESCGTMTLLFGRAVNNGNLEVVQYNKNHARYGSPHNEPPVWRPWTVSGLGKFVDIAYKESNI